MRKLLLFAFVLVAANCAQAQVAAESAITAPVVGTSAVTLQDLLRAHRERRAPLTLELHDGSTLHGIVRGVHRLAFELADPDGSEGGSVRTIPYANLRLVTVNATGERFLVQPSPTAQLP